MAGVQWREEPRKTAARKCFTDCIDAIQNMGFTEKRKVECTGWEQKCLSLEGYNEWIYSLVGDGIGVFKSTSEDRGAERCERRPFWKRMEDCALSRLRLTSWWWDRICQVLNFRYQIKSSCFLSVFIFPATPTFECLVTFECHLPISLVLGCLYV